MDLRSARRLPEVVRRLGWVSFFTDVCSESVYPLIPLFLTQTLGASARLLGLVEGVCEALIAWMRAWSGIHSDRAGTRLPYIRWGYAMGTVGKGLLSLSTLWPLAFLARLTDRFGKGIRTSARDALIADAVTPATRGNAFGFHRAMDSAGALVGSGLAIAMMTLAPGEYRLAFAVALIPGVAGIWLTMLLKEAKRPEESEARDGLSLRSSIRSLSRSYWYAVGVSLLFAAANWSDTLILLHARNLGFQPRQVATLWLLFNLTQMLASWPAGILSDRFGRWAVMAPGWLLYAIAYLALGNATSLSMWFLFPLYGVAIGTSAGAGRALIADFASPKHKGAAFGIFYMLSSIITILANLLAGSLFDRHDVASAYRFGAACAIAGVLCVPFLLRHSRRVAETLA